MTCRDFIDFIADYFDDALPPDVRQPFAGHLARCPACGRYLAQYRALLAGGRTAFAQLDAKVPHEVPEQLVSAILESRRQSRS